MVSYQRVALILIGPRYPSEVPALSISLYNDDNRVDHGEVDHDDASNQYMRTISLIVVRWKIDNSMDVKATFSGKRRKDIKANHKWKSQDDEIKRDISQ